MSKKIDLFNVIAESQFAPFTFYKFLREKGTAIKTLSHQITNFSQIYYILINPFDLLNKLKHFSSSIKSLLLPAIRAVRRTCNGYMSRLSNRTFHIRNYKTDLNLLWYTRYIGSYRA